MGMTDLTSTSNIPSDYILYDPAGDGLFLEPNTLFDRLTETALPFLDYIEPLKMFYDTARSAVTIYTKGTIALASDVTDVQVVHTYEAIIHTVKAVSLVFTFRFGLALAAVTRITKDSMLLAKLTVKGDFKKVPNKLLLISFSIFTLSLLIFPSVPLLASALVYRLSCSIFISYHKLFDDEISNKITSIALYYLITCLSLPILLLQRLAFPRVIKN